MLYVTLPSGNVTSLHGHHVQAVQQQTTRSLLMSTSDCMWQWHDGRYVACWPTGLTQIQLHKETEAVKRPDIRAFWGASGEGSKGSFFGGFSEKKCLKNIIFMKKKLFHLFCLYLYLFDRDHKDPYRQTEKQTSKQTETTNTKLN